MEKNSKNMPTGMTVKPNSMKRRKVCSVRKPKKSCRLMRKNLNTGSPKPTSKNILKRRKEMPLRQTTNSKLKRMKTELC